MALLFCGVKYKISEVAQRLRARPIITLAHFCACAKKKNLKMHKLWRCRGSRHKKFGRGMVQYSSGRRMSVPSNGHVGRGAGGRSGSVFERAMRVGEYVVPAVTAGRMAYQAYKRFNPTMTERIRPTRAPRGKKVVSSYPGSRQSTAVLKSKKGGKRGRSMPQFTTKQKKSIKRIAKSAQWQKAAVREVQRMVQWTSAVNKVAWGFVAPFSYASTFAHYSDSNLKTAEWVEDYATQQRAFEMNNLDEDYASASTVYPMKIKGVADLYLKNNTNFQAEITLYTFRCVEETSTSPQTDIDNRLREKYNTTATAASMSTKEDNFFQYFSVANSQKPKWKIESKQQVTLCGGEEAKLRLSGAKLIKNNDFEVTASDYKKGDCVFVYRIMGVPSHDTTTKTLLGVANTSIDVMARDSQVIYVKGGSSKGNVLQENPFNINFTAITPVQADVTEVTPATFAN